MARAREGVENADLGRFCKVSFSLGTRGFRSDALIWKIGASTETDHFNTYTKLVNDTWQVITVVNGLEVVDVSVDTDLEETLINKFLEFLRTRDKSRPVILIAHNAYGFHGPRILRLVKRLDMMREFQSRVAGIACTFLLFQEEYPERHSHTLRNVAQDIPGFNWQIETANNATSKAKIIMTVIRHYQVQNLITNRTESVEAVLERVEINNRKASLKRIAELSDHIRKKIAKAGFDYEDLVEAYFGTDPQRVLQLLQTVKLRRHHIHEILEHLSVLVPGALQPIV